ncbi:MAG: hypothetical protein ACE5LU_19930 [Anaerolineae bacterium]
MVHDLDLLQLIEGQPQRAVLARPFEDDFEPAERVALLEFLDSRGIWEKISLDDLA